MNHTPGPWIREGFTVFALTNCGRKKGIEQFKNRFWLRIYGYSDGSEVELEANAMLIVAAPDLLKALEMVRDADEDCKRDGLKCMPSFARAKIDAAIAKAKGFAV